MTYAADKCSVPDTGMLGTNFCSLQEQAVTGMMDQQH